MIRKRNLILLATIIIIVPLSCKKIVTLPPEPFISFTDFRMFDSTDILGNSHKAGVLEFYFEDGDGDIGLFQPFPGDLNPDTTNLTFHLFKKENGIFSEPDDTIGYRVPFIKRIGQNKTLHGDIHITFLYIGFAENDTIMYEFFLEDRAGNISNTSESCEIVFTGDGGCVNPQDQI